VITSGAWRELIGHDWAVELLSAAMRHGRIGHAYLITGPAQIGKTTLARAFAQALNCLSGDVVSRPCGRCRACTLIAANRHPDVRLLTGEVSGRGKLTIKIDQIRTLQHDLNLAAYEARWKVAILKQFDAATAGAANAFLKTLEEPPSKVILLLTAHEADGLLPTITSRCRTLALRPLPAATVIDTLEERYHVPPEQARLLGRLADGRMGWAIRAAQDAAVLQTRDTQVSWLQEALAGRRVDRFALADKLSRKPEELPAILQTWLSWWRDVALLAYGDGTAVAISNVDHEAELRRLASLWLPDRIATALQRTAQAITHLEGNANTRLVLENLLLVYPRYADTG
jgi:DNA polymerase III subunit delta'